MKQNCKNSQTYSIIRNKVSQLNKGLNKYNSNKYKKSSETQKGRTIDEYEPNLRMAQKRRGRTKENHEGTKRMADSLRGRTKETHSYLKDNGLKSAKALSGRTKETYDYLRNMSEKKKGRTKENDEGIKQMAEKLNKLDLDARNLIVIAKNNGISFIKLHKFFSHVSYSTITNIYKREKDKLNLSDFEINSYMKRVEELFSKEIL